MKGKYKITIHICCYDLIEYILAICIIFNCRSIWLSEYNKASIYSNVLQLITVFCLLGCILLKKKKSKINFSKGIFFAALFFSYIMVLFLLHSYNRSGLLKNTIVCTIIVFYYICCQSDVKVPTIIIKYINIMFWIGLISCLIWILGSIFNIIPLTSELQTTWTWTGEPKTVKGYFGIQYEVQHLNIPVINQYVARNTSFFTEGPMAAFNFSMALLFESILHGNKRKYIIAILILANSSTLSTMGLLVTLFCIFYLFTNSKYKHMGIKLLKYFCLPIVIIVIIIISKNLIASKFDMAVTYSGNVRLDDFAAGYKCWKKSPIFGYGYENNEVLIPFMSAFRLYNTGLSNSITQILINGGIYLLLPYVITLIIGLYKIINNKDTQMLIFTLAFFALFIITLVSYQWIVVITFLFILCYKYN